MGRNSQAQRAETHEATDAPSIYIILLVPDPWGSLGDLCIEPFQVFIPPYATVRHLKEEIFQTSVYGEHIPAEIQRLEIVYRSANGEETQVLEESNEDGEAPTLASYGLTCGGRDGIYLRIDSSGAAVSPEEEGEKEDGAQRDTIEGDHGRGDSNGSSDRGYSDGADSGRGSRYSNSDGGRPPDGHRDREGGCSDIVLRNSDAALTTAFAHRQMPHRSKRWSKEEIDALLTALERIAVGQWKRIQTESGLMRSDTKIREKWVTLSKTVGEGKANRQPLDPGHRERILRILKRLHD